MSNYKGFDIQQHVDVAVMHLIDHHVLDQGRINVLRDEMLRFIDEQKPAKLLVNFGGVTACSSQMIGCLITVWKHLSAEGGQMKLCGMHEYIRESFRICKLDGPIFEIYDSAPEALRAF